MGKMTSKALDVYKKEAYRMLDMVALYTKECEQVEALLPRFLTECEHKTYWHLNVLHGQAAGIFIRHDLGETDTLHSLEGVLSAVLDAGWVPQPTEDFMDGWGKSYPHRKAITIGGKEHWLFLTLRVFPHPNSQTCKKVQVGMEPKYELRCVGGER